MDLGYWLIKENTNRWKSDAEVQGGTHVETCDTLIQGVLVCERGISFGWSCLQIYTIKCMVYSGNFIFRLFYK